MSARTRVVMSVTALAACLSTALTPSASAVEPGPEPRYVARSVNYLCMGYDACARAGMSSSGYDRARGTMYWQMYSGHNCTNYAAYRMVKSGMPNVRPWSGGGNATYWGTSMSRITNQTPAVGAVAWWKAYAYPAGSAGHVAYVERVVSSTEIIVSQDSWGGDFSWARITKSSGGWPTGFVHFHDVGSSGGGDGGTGGDVTLSNTARPTVSGTAQVGGVLTASPGTWKPSDVTTTYQWRADGDSIPGATSRTFQVTAAQLGERIRVRVTASTKGAPATSAASHRTPVVVKGELESSGAPAIVGDPQVGETVTADAGEWSATPDDLTYAWQADGAPVAGADQAKLTLQPSLVGKTLTVTVTAHKAGYTDAQATTAATGPVTAGQLEVVERPEVTGTPRVGETLEVAPGRAAPEGSGLVRWLRAGTPIRGANEPTYTVRARDAGSHLTVRVRWTREGYTPVRARSMRTARVEPVS